MLLIRAELLIFLAACAIGVPASAANGTWTNPNGGKWSHPTNWSDGAVAGGDGNTADFTTLSLATAVNVSLDTPQTLSALSFDDQNSTKHNWTLLSQGDGVLTLAGSAPTIGVMSATTTILSPLAGTAGLTKTGPGILVLKGVNTYTGPTIVSGGRLVINGSLARSPIRVQAGAGLEGIGVLHDSIGIESGGILEPGDAGIGILSILGPVRLAGTVRMEISKAGMALASDRIAGSTMLQYGGELVVSNTGFWPLEAGDTFTLFQADTYTNTFSKLHLPPLASGLGWDSANLAVDGSITVIPLAGAPRLIREPQGLTLTPGATARFHVIASGPRPWVYRWQKDGIPLPGATNSSYELPAVTSNDMGNYQVAAISRYGSVTSAVARLTVIPHAPLAALTNGLVVYLNFDANLKAQAGTTNCGSIYANGAVNGPRYTAGQIGQALLFANSASAGPPEDWAVSLGNLEWIYAGDFSLSLWIRTTSTGDGALIGNKNWSKGTNTGWLISCLDRSNVHWNTAGGIRRDLDLNPPFSDGCWHLVTVTVSRTANQLVAYMDGRPVHTATIGAEGSASMNAGLDTLIGASGSGAFSGSGGVDDLGIWTRVLMPEEVSGIYAGGVDHRPLTVAIAGRAPVITRQPANIVIAPGRTATFDVNASGGAVSYQWQFNGTNLLGATNATLILTDVTDVNQGLYRVRLSNGSGTVLSDGARLTTYPLAVTGQWDFERGDLRATIGDDLEYLADTADLTVFTNTVINGQTAQIMAFGAHSPSQGFYLRHGGQPNGGGHFVNQYTLLFDLRVSNGRSGDWRALVQTHPFNHPGNPAEFFIANDSARADRNGVGAGGEIHGTLLPNTWYRIALAVDLTAPAGQQLATYVNGVQVGQQSLPGGVDGRYALGPAILLFTSGQKGFIQSGMVNSIQFVNGWMPPKAIAALGSPTAAGLSPGQTLKNLPEVNLVVTNTNVKWNAPDMVVGQLPNEQQSLPTKQILRAAGSRLQFAGRPVDLALSPDETTTYIKNLNNLLVVDTASWRIRQTLAYPGSGASAHGVALSPDGAHVYVTGAGNELYEWSVSTNGIVGFTRTIPLPGKSYPCGLALTPDGARAYVCLSIPNELAVVELATGSVSQTIPVGVAPWDVVLAPDGTMAYVSDWGGRRAVSGDSTALSAGTPVVIDSRGVAATGVVSFVNRLTGTEVAQVGVGLHPSDLELSRDGRTLYVANANSDTVSVIDTQTRTVRETILVRPDPAFPYGSATVGLCLSRDQTRLFVATGGNNAVAVVELPNTSHTNSILLGYLPTDWYPGAVVADNDSLSVVNIKGLGSRDGEQTTNSWQITAFLGTANRIPLPDSEALAKYTAQVFQDSRVPQIRQAQQVLQAGQPPVPVPARVGEPSVFKHVLYILKENKTYDQIFGDFPQANGDSNLCIYPRFVSPNHHALAEQFVLLDNFYCNGVNSADGHAWSTEANSTDHLEKGFGGFTRSYTFGDDPISYSSTGFLWNNVLQHGLTFRNYGEMDYASPSPAATWLQIYRDFTNGTRSIRYVQKIGIASLRPYSSTNVPGWNMNIPDVVRADGFIRELHAAQTSGIWASFHLLYLPNDHTGGSPSPRAQVADNDLSLGRVVEAVSKSVFWKDTVIFVIEDDPQSGYDHVDAHRSICLVISPYTKRKTVLSTFYNQAGVLHTMERILGLPPMNQQDAMAPLMFGCFTNTPDFTPYTALPANLPLEEGVVTAINPSRRQRYWAKQIQRMDFSRPDRIDDDKFNRYIWWTIKGEVPYPVSYVGGHGKGLKQLGLVLSPTQRDDDDD